MSSTTSRKRKRTRRVSTEEEREISEVPEAGIAKPSLPLTIEPEIREKLGNLISELIFDASDVAFELALLQCDKRNACPLVSKTIKLVKKVRELFGIQREMTAIRGKGVEYT